MNRIADEQRRRNAETRETWDRFRSHRHRVTRLLVDSAATDARLAVLGAGNCNDLDLGALLAAYGQVDLVDLDADALASGVARQGYDGSGRLCLRGDIDLTGIADHLSKGSPQRPLSDAELDECLGRMAGHAPLELLVSFDTVASVCLLTQLLESVVTTLGEGHPRCWEMVARVRAHHLGLLLQLVRPGGTGVLVVDFVSSATFPQLAQVPERQLPHVAVELINRRNFFTGVNPFVLRGLFESAPELAPAVEGVRMTAPWLWDFGPRVYLTSAILIRRKPTASGA
jgi:hypothetical protein